MAISTKLGAGKKIQIYFNLYATITLNASNEMCRILQATHMVSMIGSVAGKRSLTVLFQNVNLKARH